jgi:hypothetical protein
MTIRFLQTVASENPAFPFQAGQVIDVPAPSGYLLSLCDGIRAEVVRTDDTEHAVLAPAEQPEPRILHRSKGRRARVH